MESGYIQKLHFLDNGREFDCFLIDKDHPPLPEMGALADFYQIWKDSIPANHKIPQRKDISFEKLSGWHSNIRIVDYGKNISDPKNTILIGENYTKYWGRDIMNEQIHSENPPSAHYEKVYNSFLENIYDYNYAVSVGLSPNRSGSMLKVMWIDLPLCDNDGNISHLLSAIKLCNE